MHFSCIFFFFLIFIFFAFFSFFALHFFEVPICISFAPYPACNLLNLLPPEKIVVLICTQWLSWTPPGRYQKWNLSVIFFIIIGFLCSKSFLCHEFEMKSNVLLILSNLFHCLRHTDQPWCAIVPVFQYYRFKNKASLFPPSFSKKKKIIKKSDDIAIFFTTFFHTDNGFSTNLFSRNPSKSSIPAAHASLPPTNFGHLKKSQRVGCWAFCVGAVLRPGASWSKTEHWSTTPLGVTLSSVCIFSAFCILASSSRGWHICAINQGTKGVCISPFFISPFHSLLSNLIRVSILQFFCVRNSLVSIYLFYRRRHTTSPLCGCFTRILICQVLKNPHTNTNTTEPKTQWIWNPHFFSTHLSPLTFVITWIIHLTDWIRTRCTDSNWLAKWGPHSGSAGRGMTAIQAGTETSKEARRQDTDAQYAVPKPRHWAFPQTIEFPSDDLCPCIFLLLKLHVVWPDTVFCWPVSAQANT